MKRIFLFSLLFIATIATAGSYNITTTAAQDTRLERHRLRVNKNSCQAVGLPNNCTQAQCRNLNPNCDIYTDIADMIDRLVLRGYLQGLAAVDTSDDHEQFCTWWRTATVTQKNGVCSASGLPNGCEVCN